MAAALESKISDLSLAQARERRFTADVAHELRTPLTALVGEASLLEEHLDAMPPAPRRPAELLIADVGRLRRLVEDLMEISRFDAGRESVHSEHVDLAELGRRRFAPAAGKNASRSKGQTWSSRAIRAASSGSSATSSRTRSSTAVTTLPSE